MHRVTSRGRWVICSQILKTALLVPAYLQQQGRLPVTLFVSAGNPIAPGMGLGHASSCPPDAATPYYSVLARLGPWIRGPPLQLCAVYQGEVQQKVSEDTGLVTESLRSSKAVFPHPALHTRGADAGAIEGCSGGSGVCVPFWASLVCPPSCSVPGEERAICRMLEAGACGATAHHNALCGSDGDCRVPGR
ncbi:hypothetical protein AAY473_012865 [Plecturocebus cupreus]